MCCEIGVRSHEAMESGNASYLYALSESAEKEPESARYLIHELRVPLFHNDEDQGIGRDFDQIIDRYGCNGGRKSN